MKLTIIQYLDRVSGCIILQTPEMRANLHSGPLPDATPRRPSHGHLPPTTGPSTCCSSPSPPQTPNARWRVGDPSSHSHFPPTAPGTCSCSTAGLYAVAHATPRRFRHGDLPTTALGTCCSSYEGPKPDVSAKQLPTSHLQQVLAHLLLLRQRAQ